MYRIGIDLMGGDNAPLQILEGVFYALFENKDLFIKATFYSGLNINECIKSVFNSLPKRSRLRNFIKSDIWRNRIDFVSCESYVSMKDKPSVFLKSKDNSLRKVFEFLKMGEIDGVVYAGNTGAFLEGSVLLVGRMDNVKRPALLTLLPFGTIPVFLLDSGANPECKPDYILQFAIMSSVYFKMIFSKIPSVGLLNIGSEDIKGSNLVKEANELLKKFVSKFDHLFNYSGFVEPYDVVRNKVNIVLADGFSGNIMLKSFESLSEYIMDVMKKEFSKSIINKALGILLRGNFRRLKNSFDYSEYGGAIMLGLKGICIKTHGRANFKAIKNSINFALRILKNNVNSEIEERLRNISYERL